MYCHVIRGKLYGRQREDRREAARWWLRTGLFPDGAIFVSLEGNPSPGRAIVEVGQALEGVDFLKRDDADRRAWLADELAKRRMLIVWDNFESVLPHFLDCGFCFSRF